MRIALFSIILNHHQVCLADEFYNILDKDFTFVELENLTGDNRKGSFEDYSSRPYLLQAWKNDESAKEAMSIALSYDVCIFDGGFDYQKARLKTSKLTFEFSERWLKGWKNWFSPRLWKSILSYHLYGWDNKPLYKLCASAFAKHDQDILRTYKGKCYKFGYFTEVPNIFLKRNDSEISNASIQIMWCARFIGWKHPEIAIGCIRRLIGKGYNNITLNMYGDGKLRHYFEQYVKKLKLDNTIIFHGNIPNEQILLAMRNCDIFLFTSDRNEGWGAVANEALANGCCLVGSDEIGSIPYLVEDGYNGLIFRNKDISSLTSKVERLINNPTEMANLRINAYERMNGTWSPKNAAESFIRLVNDLNNGKDTSINNGPCSKA